MVNNVISGSHNLFGILIVIEINSLMYTMNLDDVGAMQYTEIFAYVLLLLSCSLSPAYRRVKFIRRQ